jgi:Flp pilus assembly CpaE family ATPase
MSALVQQSRTWRSLVVCPAAEMSRRLSGALRELGVAEVGVSSTYPGIGTVAALAAESRPNIAFVDAHSDQEHGLLLIGELSPFLPVVALLPSNDADLILRALRRGATEFLSDPATEQVKAVLERLGAKRQPAEPGGLGKIYCMVPGKPGSGASTFAMQLAGELRRRGSPRVLLVDLDAASASIAFQLKLKSDFHAGDAVRDAGRLDDDLWERLTVKHEGLDFLLAPAGATVKLGITQTASAELVSFVRPRYTHSILDHGGATAAVESGIAMLADEILLVTTNELSVLHTTRRAIECLEYAGVERAKLRLVVSRYSLRAGLKREDMKAAVGLEPCAILGADPTAVQNAILEGKPVMPSSAYGRAVEEFARRLTEVSQPVQKKRHGGWLGLFARAG